MKVQQSIGRRQHQQPQETITLVPHAACHSDPEEELVTITTQATPGSYQAEDRVVVQPVSGILVTDISAGALTDTISSWDDVTLPPLAAVTPTGATHHAATTTTTTHSSAPLLSTPSYVPVPGPVKASAPLQWSRDVASNQGRRARLRGTTLTRTTTTKAAVPLASPMRQAGGVLVDSQSGQGTADTLHTLKCEPKTPVTPSLPPAPYPEHCRNAATSTRHLTTGPNGAVGSCSDVALTTCAFCGDVSGAGNTSTVVNLQVPLPHSLLEPTSLLHCLRVVPPAGVTPTDADDQATLCQKCHALLCEGDQAYHHLMEVMVNMRQRWGGLGTRVPAIFQGNNKEQQAAARGAKRLRPILPKPSGTVCCDLCGAHLDNMEEWHLHATTRHRLTLRWRSPKLQTALKVCLAKELQRGSGQRGGWRCLACSHSFSRAQEFVEHLQSHHAIAVDENFLACLGGAARGEWGMAGQRGGGGDACLGKEEKEEVVKVKEEAVVEEEVVEDEEEVIEEEERIVKGEEQYKKVGEKEVEEEEEEEELKSSADSLLEEQQSQSAQEECYEESEGVGAGARQLRRQGGKWKCRVCAAEFTSQHDHDMHKAGRHPGSMRARRGTTWPAAPHDLPRRVVTEDGSQHNSENPAAACQEGTIVILEGDGHGGVTHHRLVSTGSPEAPQGEAQDTASQTPATLTFPCPACKKVFADRLALVRHRRATHPGPGEARTGEGVVLVECPLCGRRLAGPPALQHHLARVHRRSSHPPLRHRCRLCLCQCHTRPQLERHMRERHGAPPPPPPVRCGRCGKTYSARYIDSHLANMHGDSARFPCSFCPMKFGTRTGLRTHVSLEHANTTWACQECPLQFAKYHQLRQHRLYIHSRTEHCCRECPRSFKRRCDLTEHIKRRHQERQPSECSFCPKVYSDRKRLRIHLMRKHSVAWEDTLAKGYARRQRENNCLRRRHQQPNTPRPPYRDEEQQPTREEAEGDQGGMLGGQQEYSVVHLTEAPHPLADTISYIILEEA